jgi:hypothetical protein
LLCMNCHNIISHFYKQIEFSGVMLL